MRSSEYANSIVERDARIGRITAGINGGQDEANHQVSNVGCRYDDGFRELSR